METADLTISMSGDCLTLWIKGEIDHHSARPIREQMDAALLLNRPSRLVMRLEGMHFMDSAGLGLILGRVATAKELGVRVVVEGADPRALRIMEMAGMLTRSDVTVKIG